MACLSFTANAQNVSSTNVLTSGGFQAGTVGQSGTYYGHMAGLNTSGDRNTFIGHQAGKENTTGRVNTSLGAGALFNNTSGYENTSIGAYSGQFQYGNRNTYLGVYAGLISSGTPGGTGTGNLCLGYSTGRDQPGSYNSHLGYYSGYNASGSYNATLGYYSGYGVEGAYNTLLGARSGYNSEGDRNVFIGYYAGYNLTGDDLLCIENSSSSIPLIWGDFAADELKFNGKVGIGLDSADFPDNAAGVDVSNYRLIVNGGILATEVRVATSWADYVFEDGYSLPTLEEVKCYIEENGHLPNVPSAKEVEEQGIEVGQMAKIQQEKIEELTLYIIAQNEELKSEKEINKKQDEEIKELKEMVRVLLERNQQ